jgi:hypothetical protein
VKPCRRIAAIAATMAAMMLFSVITATTADAAYPTAYNQEITWLTSDPVAGMDPAEVDRPISLVQGCYLWLLRYSGHTYHPRTITLEAGDYYWGDTLTPGDGLYWQVSVLDPPNNDPYAYNPPDAPWAWGDDSPYPSGNVQWGSSLQWLYGGNCVS